MMPPVPASQPNSHVAKYLINCAEINARNLMRTYSILAIYKQSDAARIDTDQVATGFLLTDERGTILVAAKHSLCGRDSDEAPLEKLIFAGGSLRRLGDIAQSDIADDGTNDIAALRIQTFADLRPMRFDTLEPDPSKARVITIAGYLGRDFHRDAKLGVLKPKRYVYTNKQVEHGAGYVALLHPRFQNRTFGIAEKVRAPIPRGLSGCPMMDAMHLARGKISIVGVFTNFTETGKSFGERSSKIFGLLGRLYD